MIPRRNRKTLGKKQAQSKPKPVQAAVVKSHSTTAKKPFIPQLTYAYMGQEPANWPRRGVNEWMQGTTPTPVYAKVDYSKIKNRNEIIDTAINQILGAEADPNKKKQLETLLRMTNYMENKYGEADDAWKNKNVNYGFTELDKVSIDNLFKPKGDKENYTKGQKNAFEYLKNFGLPTDQKELEKLLLNNDPLANMAVSRLVYATNPNPLPDMNDQKAVFNYWLNDYNHRGAIKHHNEDELFKIFQEGYNKYNSPNYKPVIHINSDGTAIIDDNRGQWDHPGEVTRIGSNNITMKGVPYPVLGVGADGEQKMMYPEEEHTFNQGPVTEYPMMQAQNGGWLSKYQKAGAVMPADVMMDPKKLAQWMKDHPESRATAPQVYSTSETPIIVKVAPEVLEQVPINIKMPSKIDYPSDDPRSQIAIHPMDIEEQFFARLGYPNVKGHQQAFVGPNEDEMDNARHSFTGMYTGQAVRDYLDNSLGESVLTRNPIVQGVTAGIGAATAAGLGLGHEASTYLNDPRWNQPTDRYGNPMPWYKKAYTITREGLEDQINNTVGATIGALPISDEQKDEYLWDLIDNDQLPDGYGAANVFGPNKGGAYRKNLQKHKRGGVTWLNEYAQGGKIFSSGGEKHKVYKKESPTGNGKGVQGHIMVTHPTMDKGKWDTIDLTEKSGARTVAQGVAATKKWHAENPEYQTGGPTTRYSYVLDDNNGNTVFDDNGNPIIINPTTNYTVPEWLPQVNITAPRIVPSSGSAGSAQQSNGSLAADIVLDGMQFVPGPLGAAASAVGVGKNLYEGDYVGAGLDLANLVTLGGAKWLTLASDLANAVAKANKARRLARQAKLLEHASNPNLWRTTGTVRDLAKVKTTDSNPEYKNEPKKAPNLLGKKNGGWLNNYK